MDAAVEGEDGVGVAKDPSDKQQEQERD